MSQEQIITIALTTIPNLVVILVGLLINNSRLADMNGRLGDMNARINDLNGRLNDMNTRLNDMNTRLNDMNVRINELRIHMDQRFDDMRDLWRSELHRVEEVIDARLKHLEER